MPEYYMLGRSGLRVSRLCLGALTFGEKTFDGLWGTDAVTSRRLFDRYLDRGGNFIDTADVYTQGESESLLGTFIAESGSREQIVLATKYSQCTAPGFPNHAGNGRKNMMRALDESLRRLRTDYVDLYILHLWDRHTPAEEVVHTFDDLVRAGKIRYAGMSDVPAWYAAQAQTYAEAHALAPITSIQLPYSLIERSLEPEFPSLALTLGMGITAWSPLGMGILSGKYLEGRQGIEGQGRLTSTTTTNILGYFSSRNFAIAAVVREVAAQIERSPAQVAINWVANRPAVNCVIVGASKIEQLNDNLGALDFTLPRDLEARLNEVSRVVWGAPYSMFQNDFQHTAIDANTTILGKPSGYYDL